MSFRSMRLHFPLIATLGLLLLGAPAPACGPDFPNAYLAMPAEEFARLPTLSFPAELARLLPPGTPPAPAAARTSEGSAETAELRTALAEAGLSQRDVEAALAAYDRMHPPAALPPEFHLYARGALAWSEGKSEPALAAWRELLALPEAQRRHRTVWAHYMTGRVLWDVDAPAARRAFQAARQAAQAGFADGQELATASLGWEARTYLAQQDYPAALRLYYQQYLAHGPGAVRSLQMVLQQLFQEEDGAPATDAALAAVAADASSRGIVTAWFVSRGGPNAPWSAHAVKQFRRWLSALPRDHRLTSDEADRWAWAAYQNGLWDEAREFTAVAPADAPASEWVRAMLRLREGDLEGATSHLAGAARGFPRDAALQSPFFLADENRREATGEDLPPAHLGGVRGVLALQREQYLESLRLFRSAGHWTDAAYVAEHVLTLEELAAFVAAEVPAPKPVTAGADAAVQAAGEQDGALRYLLGRRLVRAGQFDRAREFLPASVVGEFDRYVALVRRGYDAKQRRRTRANALWEAAQLARNSGMEFQGTELEPDFAIWGGSFEWPQIAARRHAAGGGSPRWTWEDEPEPSGFSGVLLAPASETERSERARLPTRRFHYRQRAAELAFLAATLLPDNDELTATILNTAGRWVAPRYPDDAQLIYKTLVFRCAKTKLGQAAAQRHWFVPPPDAERNR